jgi:hypothetical protein
LRVYSYRFRQPLQLQLSLCCSGRVALPGASRQLQQIQKLLKAGKKACKAATAANGGIDVIDLNPYRGPFGQREAAILGERFCFGFSAAEQAQAASIGLNAKVNDMLTWKQVPSEEAAVADD